MTNREDSLRARERLDVAFRVGAGGSIILGVLALTSASRAALLALAVWTYATLFVIPHLYDWYIGDAPPVPEWVRGPFQ